MDHVGPSAENSWTIMDAGRPIRRKTIIGHSHNPELNEGDNCGEKEKVVEMVRDY